MEAQSSSGLLLSRKRRREGSNGETDEGERLGKIPRCTVVSQLDSSTDFEVNVWPAVSVGYLMYILYRDLLELVITHRALSKRV